MKIMRGKGASRSELFDAWDAYLTVQYFDKTVDPQLLENPICMGGCDAHSVANMLLGQGHFERSVLYLADRLGACVQFA